MDLWQNFETNRDDDSDIPYVQYHQTCMNCIRTKMEKTFVMCAGWLRGYMRLCLVAIDTAMANKDALLVPKLLSKLDAYKCCLFM